MLDIFVNSFWRWLLKGSRLWEQFLKYAYTRAVRETNISIGLWIVLWISIMNWYLLRGHIKHDSKKYWINFSSRKNWYLYHLLNTNHCCYILSAQLIFKVPERPLNLLKAQIGVLHGRGTYVLNRKRLRSKETITYPVTYKSDKIPLNREKK